MSSGSADRHVKVEPQILCQFCTRGIENFRFHGRMAWEKHTTLFPQVGYLIFLSRSKFKNWVIPFPPLCRNTSIGVCQCEVSQWESFLRNERNSMISPYESGFIDVKINKETSTFFSVALEEGKVLLHLNLFLLVVHKITLILRHFLFFLHAEFHLWRLGCLGFGLLIFLIAPGISNWMPFYYSSSMILGVFLLVLILLFQVMSVEWVVK